MKAFIRVVAGVLLSVLLLTFSLWRYDAIPDFSGFVAFLEDTGDRMQMLGEYQPQNLLTGARPADQNGEFPEYEVSEPLDADLETLICNALQNCEESVSVASFEKTPEEIKQAMTTVRFNHPELFYVDKSYTYSHELGRVTKLNFQYTASKAEVAAMTAEYNSMLQTIVAGAPQQGTDFDKALYIHDYFVKNFCYDYTYTIRDAYTFFKEKTGVCQAYMLAMIAVAEELGIESIPVTSNRMNHAWNMVELEGAWYHVDITWDDTVSYPTYTSYRYFLQSDAGIIAIDAEQIDENMAVPDWHCDWSATETATDIRYDTAVWRGALTPMVKGGGAYHCAVTKSAGLSGVVGAVYSGSDPAEMTERFTVNATWRLPGGTQYYVDCYTALAVWENKLIYSTPNSLRSHDLTTGEDRLLALLVEVAPGSIYGFTDLSEAGVLSYLVAPTAEPEGEDSTVEIRTYQLS